MRLDRDIKPVQGEKPMIGGFNTQYEMGAKARAIGCGGIGALHKLATNLGLDKAINEALHVPKFHPPDHESDHVLNIAYYVATGGTCLEDIKRLRQDEHYIDALGAEFEYEPVACRKSYRMVVVR